MVKNIYHFITILLIATSSLSSAMKRTSSALEPNIPLELNNVNEPQSVLCFRNNIVAITEKNGCNLYDISQNKKLIQLHNGNDIISIAAYPDKQLLAIQSAEKLAIYNIATQKKIWEKTSTSFHDKPIFNPINETIVIGHGRGLIRFFNYNDKSSESYEGRIITNVPIVLFNKGQQEAILLESNKIIITLCAEKFSFKKQLSLNFTWQLVNNAKPSSDGSLLAINCPTKGCSIVDLTSNISNVLIKKDKDVPLYAMAFHPTSFILATLSFFKAYRFLESWNAIIRYYNAKTRQFITSKVLPCDYNIPNQRAPFALDNMIAFSYKGTELIVCLDSKCIAVEVPFKTLYPRGTKEKCRFVHLVLHYHPYDNANILPRDIRYLLIKYLLKVSHYSFTNY